MEKIKDILSRPPVQLLLAMVFLILGSAKWTVTIAPWLGYAFLLYYIRSGKFRKRILISIPALYLATLIGGYNVIPAPLPVFAIIALIISVKTLVPFLIDKLLRGDRGFLSSLIFPAAFVALEYLDSWGDGGTWGSIAHTQYGFQSLLQIASVTGIWGISFLVYWFASLTNWAISQNLKWVHVKKGALISLTIYFVVLGFGLIRISTKSSAENDRVPVAGITLNNTNMLETTYNEAFGKQIDLPDNIAQTSELAKEAFKALPHFIEDAYNRKFDGTRRVMDGNIEELFRRSAIEAGKGAKIISWSEAIGIVMNDDEEKTIARGKQFAERHQVYLIMGLGVINPGPMDGEHLFMVNKTVTLSPEGVLLNIYLKSNPVPFAEQEYGSDDIIPVLATPYGNLSPVICYDADFNHFMKQTGAKNTDILFVPSGDWQAIAPYHSHMAALRGIENGCSVVRPVNRGTSLVTDPYGNILGESYFFSEDGKTVNAIVPTRGINTIYNRIGDALAYLCILSIAVLIIKLLFDWTIRKFGAVQKQPQTI